MRLLFYHWQTPMSHRRLEELEKDLWLLQTNDALQKGRIADLEARLADLKESVDLLVKMVKFKTAQNRRNCKHVWQRDWLTDDIEGYVCSHCNYALMDEPLPEVGEIEIIA